MAQCMRQKVLHTVLVVQLISTRDASRINKTRVTHERQRQRSVVPTYPALSLIVAAYPASCKGAAPYTEVPPRDGAPAWPHSRVTVMAVYFLLRTLSACGRPTTAPATWTSLVPWPAEST